MVMHHCSHVDSSHSNWAVLTIWVMTWTAACLSSVQRSWRLKYTLAHNVWNADMNCYALNETDLWTKTFSKVDKASVCVLAWFMSIASPTLFSLLNFHPSCIYMVHFCIAGFCLSFSSCFLLDRITINARSHCICIHRSLTCILSVSCIHLHHFLCSSFSLAWHQYVQNSFTLSFSSPTMHPCHSSRSFHFSHQKNSTLELFCIFNAKVQVSFFVKLKFAKLMLNDPPTLFLLKLMLKSLFNAFFLIAFLWIGCYSMSMIWKCFLLWFLGYDFILIMSSSFAHSLKHLFPLIPHCSCRGSRMI